VSLYKNQPSVLPLGARVARVVQPTAPVLERALAELATPKEVACLQHQKVTTSQGDFLV
jgi:hypothetical protein